MKWQSMLAIYALFWVLSGFLVLPFGVKTADEAGVAKVAGQADSAPHAFNFSTVALRATILSGAIFLLFLANYHFGWLTTDMLERMSP
jgi:predicted secreted protein